jgi:hypothetical protein
LARRNTKVCFVGGAGHSGSTLLGLVLGAHPSIFYAGEANKSRFLGDASVKARKRTCKVCGESCRIWSAIDPKAPLYEQLSERSGRPIVADSTKSIEWIDEQVARLVDVGVAVHLFFLGRDGRAVLASALRKRPDTGAREHASAWAEQVRATAALAARFPGPVTRIRYEALATDPAHTIGAVAAALGQGVVPAMLDPFASEQHPLGGNAGTQSLLETRRDDLAIGGAKKDYYAGHPRAFVLDMRWQKELSPEALAAFDAVAGETNRPYAYDDVGGEA